MPTRAPYVMRDGKLDRSRWKPDGLSARLMAFFETNPDEELTVRQAALKFDVTEQTVDDTVVKLAAVSLLEKVRVIRLPSKGRAP